ncbi:MAG: alpha/beta hydrolase, partial [Chitinophagaceae bacterium]
MRKIGGVIAACFLTHALSAQEVIPLYEKVPGSKPSIIKESADTINGVVRIRNVSQPTLTIYRPEAGKANGTGVVICPGGGYGLLAASHEGGDVGKLFASWGITAFVLKYRLPNEAIMLDKTIGPLQDAQRALQLVRQKAADWGVDTGKLGIMGFSAGGHVAARLAARSTLPVYAPQDAAD